MPVIQRTPNIALTLPRLRRLTEEAATPPAADPDPEPCRSVVEHLAGWVSEPWGIGPYGQEIHVPEMYPELLELEPWADWRTILAHVEMVGDLCQGATVEWSLESVHEGVSPQAWVQSTDRAVIGIFMPTGAGGEWEFLATVTDPDGHVQQVSFLLVAPDGGGCC